MAEAGATPSEGPATFFEVRTAEMSRGLRGVEAKSTKTVWLGRTEVRSRSGDGPVYQEPRSADGETLAFEVNSREVRWDDLDKLPTDREALRKRLTTKVPGMGDPSPEGLFNGIEELLARSPAPPRLRAALYDLLPGIPGVRAAGTVRDDSGRTGTAFDYTGDDRRTRLVIDPRTHRVLETATFLVGDADPRNMLLGGLKDGAVVSRTTYLVTRPVQEAPPAKPLPRMTSLPLPGATAG
ncbi:CU044_5270 family protein [Streptomyces sp. CA-181903]|uniref:CU044_5270 family protein n=1 Tax=Streptomyces sp. CA-181903 TaxID=3240055 RepID=UPI003D8E478B